MPRQKRTLSFLMGRCVSCEVLYLFLRYACRNILEIRRQNVIFAGNICGGYFEIAKLTVEDFEGYCVGR